MSSRQKSFFDQDFKRKSNGQWQGYRNNGYERPQQQEKPAEPTKPPIAASAQAKQKLHAFKLTDDARQSSFQSSGKENVPCLAAQTPQRKQIPAQRDSLAPPDMLSFPPPSTPAVRLPLADLLGHSEDTSGQAQRKEESPEEQLAWRAVGETTGRHHTPGHRRKRAHSSSPATSQTDTVTQLMSRKPSDMEQIQPALKTPKADPAADLWTRYNSVVVDNGTSGPVLPSLAHLLSEVSPNSLPRTPGGSVGGLRRWASCGTEWPESGPKRRKVQPPVNERRTHTEQVDDVNGGSKLGLMVDQLLLSRPSHTRSKDDLSSSSPLPELGSFSDRRETGKLHGPGFGSRPAKPENSPGATNHADRYRPPLEATSEFGDDDIDLDELDACQAPSRVLQSDSMHDCETLPTNQITNSPNTHLVTIEEAIEDESDEFDDDNDLTAEDLEMALTQAEGLRVEQKVEEHYKSNGGAISGLGITPESIEVQNASGDQRNDSAQGSLSFSDDDEFGGLDADDEHLAAAELAATQAYHASMPSQGSTPKIASRTIQRYLIQKVVAGKYISDRGFEQDEKVLLVQEDRSKSVRAITLRQSWLDTHCNTGAYVHVVGKFSSTGQITIDDAHNLLVVHPDFLVSATAVADSFDCIRKAVLQDRVKATNMTSKATVYGSILHELFQTAMQHNRWEMDWLLEKLAELIVKFIEGLFEAGAKDTVEATETLTSKMPELRAWAARFLSGSPGTDAKAQDRNGKIVKLSVRKLLDVEEHVWSPTYGLKGNIDATVEIAMEDEAGKRRLTVPFEVKTGKYQSPAHRAQTALYTLLLSDRYDVEIQFGVLYYMENSGVNRIPAIRNELRHMVMQRNELASYVRERLSLPPMLKNEFKCGRCYARTSCFLYHKLSEDGTTETAGVGPKFNEVVAKLKPNHQEFFRKWDELLTKEETEMFKFRRELWTMLSHEREKLGRCFAEVVIEPNTAYEDRDGQKINRFAYTFMKKNAQPNFSFAESQITVGEPIVVSSEEGHYALANGYVTKVSSDRIGVAVDRRLHNSRVRQPGFDENTNQTFSAIMQVKEEENYFVEKNKHRQVVYRLDKDEFSNGMATVRNNLLAIMDDNTYRAYELRELIVGNKEPIFKPTPSAYTLSGPPSQMQINSDQNAAIDKIMSARDYALVLGMPGTGKTTTIAHIIRALAARGKSVLLTSYTHTAVDNILLKLRDSKVSVLRLGVLGKIHPEVQQFARLAALQRQSIEELEDLYMTPQVVATTCLGVNHQIFQKRIFDYCIVDEASQITLPVCLGPIRMARTFVLVGDHYQLPPLVQNREAQDGGLDISLFKLLSDRQPSSVVNLEHQYRMCADIMHLSNSLVYSGRLKCGNEDVAHRTLATPNPSGLRAFHEVSEPSAYDCPSPSSPQCQLTMLLDRSRKVVFANTDGVVTAQESLAGSRITNPFETGIVHLTTAALLAQGITPAQIGVITFYRSQLSHIRHALKGSNAETVEMHTADKFQGRDKEVIILSCVRSNKDSNVGELLRDWRRVNVAITRARSKFIIVGSRKTLMGDELWKKLISLVDGLGGTVDLDESILSGHTADHMIGGPGNECATKTEETSEVLNPSQNALNRGAIRKAPKQARIGKDLLLKKRRVSQDIMNMIMG